MNHNKRVKNKTKFLDERSHWKYLMILTSSVVGAQQHEMLAATRQMMVVTAPMMAAMIPVVTCPS